jgi:tetratricopeptide (TPR) repeat protein
MYLNKIKTVLLLIITLALTQCFTYHPDWQIPESVDRETNIDKIIQKTNSLVHNADSKEKVMELISLYESVLRADPQNFKALYELSHLYLLAGDGYSEKKSEKKVFFKRSLRNSEHAMYTNIRFKDKIVSGAEVWEAVDVLTENEIDLMLFWTTAVFYYYKECLGPMGQMINYKWIRRAKNVMEKMYEINPDYAGGAPHFTWALYYLSLPGSVGGDRKKSEELFAKAIEVGPDWLLNRWGRAKYFHVKMQKREYFKQDLEWILRQDINNMKGHPAWKIYFMNDAKNMLAQIDNYF